jgi:hypothetical protein|tara:strand:- start:317 stop:481 length:165 start_codon:yes stop_codon:yes gene_type:complete
MPFDKLEEVIEKYSKDCISETNEVIPSIDCVRLLLYLQRNILPKSKNEKINKKY